MNIPDKQKADKRGTFVFNSTCSFPALNTSELYIQAQQKNKHYITARNSSEDDEIARTPVPK